MFKNRYVLVLALSLVMGLFIVLLASDEPVVSPNGKMPIPNMFKGMKNHPLSEKEDNKPTPSDPRRLQESERVSKATAGTGAIRGRVTQATGGAPIEGVTIYVDRLECPEYYGTGYSESDGYYVIRDLPAGKYEAYTSNDSVYVDVYWNNEPLWGTPDTVTVVSNDTTENVNFALRVGGKITGTVTKPGQLVGTTTVYATDTTWNANYSGIALIITGSGSYEIKQLPTGFYKVNTAAYGDSFANEYYNNKPDWATANPVRVREDSTTTNIDFALALGGKITGTVTLPGAASVSVSVYANGTSAEGWYSGYAYGSGSSATYEIVGLPTGTYKVNTSSYGDYLDEYYNDQPDQESANPVSVTAGSTTPGINFSLDLGGIIKGTITGSGPLQNISVNAFSTTSWWWGSFGSTDVSGNYRLTGLETGYYKIFASGDSIYAYEYYNNKSNWGDADSVLVTVSDSVTGNDFSLEIGGSISGYVYGEGAVPISNANVTASHVSEFMGSKSDQTSAGGIYKIGGLRTGWYRVRASYSTECDNFSMYYDHESSWSSADSVFVEMPSNVTGINFNFPSAVGEEEIQIASKPSEFELTQNYPNPFNPGTQIEYTLQKKALVSLEIYNLLGQKVKTLVNENQSAGAYHILWDGENEKGQTIASGVYFYRLKVNGVAQTKRMVLLR